MDWKTIIQSFGPGAIVAAGMFGLFAVADGFVSKPFKKWLSARLRRLSSPEADGGQVEIFVSVFDQLFGTNFLSWRFFLRSFIASLSAVAVMVLVWALLKPTDAAGFWSILSRPQDIEFSLWARIAILPVWSCLGLVPVTYLISGDQLFERERAFAA